MSTVLELAELGGLVKLDPALEPNELEWRIVYALPHLLPQLQTELPTYVSQWRVESSPLQQFDALLEVFCSGETLTFDRMFKPLTHIQDGVWELKSPDLRLFGWFPMKDCFVMGAMDTALKVKSHNLYVGYANMVAYRRNQLSLDHPKFIPGKDPNDVVSNYDFP